MIDFVILMIACGVVTWIPRVLPFLFSNLLVFREGQFPLLKVKETVACLPALVVGYYTKDLMKIVVTGVITMAAIRFFF